MLLLKRLKYGVFIPGEPLPSDMKQLFSMLSTDPDRKMEILTKMAQIYKPAFHKSLFTKQKIKLIEPILNPYLGKRGRKDKVATIAWIIRRLELTKEFKQLVGDIISRVHADQWYVNFEESLNAMEAFSQAIPDKSLRDQIYQKIQRNVNLTIWEEHQTKYERLSKALVEAERLDAPLWATLQYHCLRNLDMDYEPQTMVNIFLNFAKAGKGSEDFYLVFQDTLRKGHFFNRAFLLPDNIHHSLSSSLVAPILEIYYLRVLRHGQQLIPDFKVYLAKLIDHPRFRLQTLQDLTTIIRSYSGLGYQQEHKKELIDNSLKRIFQLQESYVTMNDVIDFYQAMEFLEVKLPAKVERMLENEIIRSVLQGPRDLNGVLNIYKYLIDHQKCPETIEHVIEGWIEKHATYMETGELRMLQKSMREMGRQLLITGNEIKLTPRPQNLRQLK